MQHLYISQKLMKERHMEESRIRSEGNQERSEKKKIVVSPKNYIVKILTRFLFCYEKGVLGMTGTTTSHRVPARPFKQK